MKRPQRAVPSTSAGRTPGGLGPDSRKEPAVEAWLIRRRFWVLAGLVAVSIALRAIYFAQLNAGPLIELHRWEQSDMNYYDRWGRQIADGDWLSASITVPMHDWQRLVAEQYLNDHPDRRAALMAEAHASGRTPDVDLLVWTRWMRGHQFYQDPLYAYLVGLTYRFVGDDVRFVFAWQMALGVLTIVLIWLIARRYFGDIVAVCAGVLAVLCAPMMAYELILLREATIVFAGLAIVWLTDRAVTRRDWSLFMLLGAALGLACLLKSTFILLAIGVPIGIAAHFRFAWRELRVPAIALVAGFVVAFAPLVLRNRALDVSPFALASSGGLTFMLSNDVNYHVANGLDVDVPRLASGLGESGGALLPSVATTLRSQTISSYARMLWQKWDRSWYWFEIPNNDNFYYTRLQARVLRWLPVTFWLVSPLALVGLMLAFPARRRSWPLYVLVLSSLVPLLVFYVLGRFRIALVAAVIPFAALTVANIARWAFNRDYRSAAAAAAAVVVLGAWTGRPSADRLIRPSDWLLPVNAHYRFDLERAVASRDPAAAAAVYLAAFQYEPDPQSLLSPPDTSTLFAWGKMHGECASFLRQAGRTDEANAQFEKARVLLGTLLAADPSNADAEHVLADGFFERASYDDARAHYSRYLAHQPNDAGATTRLAVTLVAARRLDDALAAFRRAVDLDATHGEARRNLANALYDLGKIDEAAAHAERAAALRPKDATVHDLLGRIWARQGKMAAARAQFEKSLEIDPAYSDARDHLRAISRFPGD